MENNKLKVLIVGNTASTGWHLKKELESRGHIAHLTTDNNPVISGKGDEQLLKPKEYDIVHINFPLIDLRNYKTIFSYILNSKIIVAHWRGTDLRGISYNEYKNKKLRLPKYLLYLIVKRISRRIFFNRANYHFYSTHDLAWWLRSIPEDKRSHLYSCINTNKFKPIKCKKEGTFINIGGGKGFDKNKINHDDMPKHLNKFRKAEIYPNFEISPYILSVSAMECLACGLNVKHHQDKDRNWIIKNCSIPVFTDKVLKVYERLLEK
jgi:hypothetical protein